MDAIHTILDAYDDTPADMDPGDSYTVEVDGYEDLTIEKLDDDRLSVAQYYTQRGDLMSDPEIVFRVDGNDLTPIRYTQHGNPPAHQYDPDGIDVANFLDTWNKNLHRQGFVDAAQQGDGGE